MVLIENAQIFGSSSFANPDSNNIGLDAGVNDKTIIKNCQIENYFRGLILHFGSEAIVDNVSVSHIVQFADSQNIGIKTDSIRLCNLKNIQIINYFKGINASFSTMVLIENAKLFGSSSFFYSDSTNN